MFSTRITALFSNTLWILAIHIPHFTIGCSPIPPCGTVIRNIKLTDVPGNLHMNVDKFEDCTEEMRIAYPKKLSSTVVEVNMAYETMITEVQESSFRSAPQDLDLDSVPTVDQDYELVYSDGSEDVTVVIDDQENITFALPGFKYSGNTFDFYDGLAVFYSNEFDRFYFIYSNNDNKDFLAICKPKNAQCEISNFPKDMMISREGKDAIVYDDMKIVGFKVPCCLCISTKYYKFDKKGLKPFNILNTMEPTVVDPRVGTAYGVVGGGRDNIRVVSETIPFEQSVSLKSNKLQQALNPED